MSVESFVQDLSKDRLHLYEKLSSWEKESVPEWSVFADLPDISISDTHKVAVYILPSCHRHSQEMKPEALSQALYSKMRKNY